MATLANYAAVGALVAAALALATDSQDEGGEWMLRGTVIGGGVGLLAVALGGLS